MPLNLYTWLGGKPSHLPVAEFSHYSRFTLLNQIREQNRPAELLREVLSYKLAIQQMVGRVQVQNQANNNIVNPKKIPMLIKAARVLARRGTLQP